MVDYASSQSVTYLFAVAGETSGEIDGSNHAGSTGNTLTGNIKCGSVVWSRAHKR